MEQRRSPGTGDFLYLGMDEQKILSVQSHYQSYFPSALSRLIVPARKQKVKKATSALWSFLSDCTKFFCQSFLQKGFQKVLDKGQEHPNHQPNKIWFWKSKSNFTHPFLSTSIMYRDVCTPIHPIHCNGVRTLNCCHSICHQNLNIFWHFGKVWSQVLIVWSKFWSCERYKRRRTTLSRYMPQMVIL